MRAKRKSAAPAAREGRACRKRKRTQQQLCTSASHRRAAALCQTLPDAVPCASCKGRSRACWLTLRAPHRACAAQVPPQARTTLLLLLHRLSRTAASYDAKSCSPGRLYPSPCASAAGPAVRCNRCEPVSATPMSAHTSAHTRRQHAQLLRTRARASSQEALEVRNRRSRTARITAALAASVATSFH